jgi:hypothetical protein
MQAAYPFLSSARTDAWLRHSTSPLLLSGRLVKRVYRPSQWAGLLLSPTVISSPSPSKRTTRHCGELIDTRRTIEPEYNCKPRLVRSQSDIPARTHTAEIGFRTKSVLREGKAVQVNTCSAGNMLNSRRNELYKGLVLYQRRERPVKKEKGVSEYQNRLSLSQIISLPGRAQTPNSPKRLSKPSKKNISHIDSLGGCFTPQSEPNWPERAGYMRRNLETSIDFEPERRKSPIKSSLPRRSDLISYKRTGEEMDLTRRLKAFRPMKVAEQAECKRTLRARPTCIPDQFTPSFKLF